MTKKEHTTITELFQVLDLLESLDMQFWLDGGWGVDVLYGQQTRLHRDIDIDFDANYTDQLLDLLQERGYQIETNWLPTRVELYSKELGYIDIHPFVLNADGTSKQADLDGGWYEFQPDYFGTAVFEGRSIPCISAKGQQVFHSGYDLREKDIHDLSGKATHPFADKFGIALYKADDAVVVFGIGIAYTSALYHLECCQ